MPATGRPPTAVPDTSPYCSDDEAIEGSIARGIPMRSKEGSCQSRVSSDITIVRDGFAPPATSPPPFPPPVTFHSTHVSIVPKHSSPFSARERAPSTLSRIHAIFGPEKYVESG